MDKFPIPQKMTHSRLEALLKELDLKYEISNENNIVKIAVPLPEEAIEQEAQAKEIRNKSVLSDSYEMTFRQEKIFPLVRKINGSSNLTCETKCLKEETILLISKK